MRRFADWADILRHGRRNGLDDEAVDRELATAINFVEKYEYQTPHILDSIVAWSGSPQDAAASFSTAHRAKGLEWDRVTILDDFPRLAPLPDDEEELEPPSKPELNLLYVAVTRGKSWLDLNGTRYPRRRAISRIRSGLNNRCRSCFFHCRRNLITIQVASIRLKNGDRQLGVCVPENGALDSMVKNQDRWLPGWQVACVDYRRVESFWNDGALEFVTKLESRRIRAVPPIKATRAAALPTQTLERP